MKMSYVAALLLANASAIHVNKGHAAEEHETQLAQSFATALNMAPPKLMSTEGMTNGGKDQCPVGGTELTYDGTKGAFLDGCYMNTTRSSRRNEATGEEAQNYLYMWKHACAFTKWVPSNQFMYSGLDYNPQEMTLERFGFIGMDKRCFWGSIGVLWKRPLPVEQILPNATIPAKPEGPTDTGRKYYVNKGNLFNKKSASNICLVPKSLTAGSEIWLDECKTDGSTTWVQMQNSQFIHVKSNLCLTIKNGEDLTKQTMEECDSSILNFKQRWQQLQTEGDWFQITNYEYDDMCVDLPKKEVANEFFTARNWKCAKESDDDNMQYKWIN